MIDKVFNEDGEFFKFLEKENKKEEFDLLKDYISLKCKLSRINTNLSSEELKSFEKVDKFFKDTTEENSYQNDCTRIFITLLLSLPKDTDLNIYINQSDYNFSDLYVVVNDDLAKRFFESVPFDEWL